MLPGRRLTLLIIPEEGGRTYEYKLPRLLLWVALVVSVGVAVLLGIGVRSWVQNGYLKRHVERLERDKQILSDEVKLIEELEGMLAELEQSNLKLRSMATEAVGLNTRAAPERTSRTREPFISVQRRLEHGSLRTVPTLAPVELSSWRVDDHGVLLRAPRGALVQAAAAGSIQRISYDRDLGYTVLIDHGNGLQTRYAGMSTLVVEGETFVHKGEALGLLGWPRNGAPPGVRFVITENGRDRTRDYVTLWL